MAFGCPFFSWLKVKMRGKPAPPFCVCFTETTIIVGGKIWTGINLMT